MFSSLPVHSMSSSCFLSFLLIVLGLSAAYIYIYIFALSSELDGLTIFYYYLLFFIFFCSVEKNKTARKHSIQHMSQNILSNVKSERLNL